MFVFTLNLRPIVSKNKYRSSSFKKIFCWLLPREKRDKVHLHIQFARDSLPRHSLSDGGCHVLFISTRKHRRKPIITDQALAPYFLDPIFSADPIFSSLFFRKVRDPFAIGWLHYADHHIAPLTRSQGGSIRRSSNGSIVAVISTTL